MFYCPNHSMRIFETGNVRFIENGEISGSIVPWDVEIKKVRVQVSLTCASSNKVIAPSIVVLNNNEEDIIMSPWYIMNLLWKNHNK